MFVTPALPIPLTRARWTQQSQLKPGSQTASFGEKGFNQWCLILQVSAGHSRQLRWPLLV